MIDAFFTFFFLRGGHVDKTTAVRLQEASLHHSHMAECFDFGAKRVYAVYLHTTIA